jgi:hypothetical protein
MLNIDKLLNIIQENYELNKPNGFENIKKVKYLNELDELRIPRNKILICGSATLALYGLRDNKDLDVAVSKDMFKKLEKDKRFKRIFAGSGSKVLNYKNVDIHRNNWPFKNTVEDELKKSLIIDGYHFYSIYRLLEWKKKVNRDKDQKDARMISKFIKDNNIDNRR